MRGLDSSDLTENKIFGITDKLSHKGGGCLQGVVAREA